jgi:hypothetical protein
MLLTFCHNNATNSKPSSANTPAQSACRLRNAGGCGVAVACATGAIGVADPA